MSNSILDRAQMYADDEKYEEAYALLEGAYEQMKGDAEYLEKIALMAKTLEKHDETVRYWEELVAISPDSVIGYSELLDAYIDTDKYKYYITRAKYKILNEKFNQAIDDFKKAIGTTNEPDKIVNARFLLAKSYENLGKMQEAIDEYHRILETNDDAAISYKLADLYAQTGDRYSAINILEKAIQTRDIPELKDYLAALYMKEGIYDKSVQYAQNSFSKAKALLMKGDNEAALELLNAVEDKTNANYPALMAEYYFNKKDWDNCRKYIEDFKNIDNQNPLVYQMSALVCDANKDSYGYHYNMGRCYSFKGDYDLALAEYLNAHRAEPKRTEAVKEIIKINEAKGDKTSLMEFYEKLVRQEPDNPIALTGLGDVYFDMYELPQALEYYQKAAKADPNAYPVYKKIGECAEKMRKTQTAAAAYEKYVSLAPISPDTEKIKEKLQTMKSSATGEAEAQEEGFLDKIMKFFSK